jgi:hypothetical protein
MFNQVYEKEIKLSEIKERAFSVIPTKVGIHNDLKMLVLDLDRGLDSRLHGNDYLGYLRQNSKVSLNSGTVACCRVLQLMIGNVIQKCIITQLNKDLIISIELVMYNERRKINA